MVHKRHWTVSGSTSLQCPLPLSQHLPCPKWCSSWLSSLDGVKRKWASRAASHLSGESWVLILTLSRSPSEKSWSRAASFGIDVCCLGWRSYAGKVKPSFPFQCIHIHTCVFFSLQQFDATPPLDSWIPAKALSSVCLTVLWGAMLKSRSQVTRPCWFYHQDRGMHRTWSTLWRLMCTGSQWHWRLNKQKPQHILDVLIWFAVGWTLNYRSGIFS